MPSIHKLDVTGLVEKILYRDPSREDGIHLSGIIYAIMHHLQPNTYRGSSSKDNSFAWRIMLGSAWEATLEVCLADWFHSQFGDDYLLRPPQYRLDGVWGSPDGLNLRDNCIEEYKVTWKAAPSEQRGTSITDDKFLYYVMQMKGYCKMTSCSKSRLWVLFVNGDYKGGYTPDLIGWEFDWTQEELDDNWEMLLRWKPRAVAEVTEED